MCGVINFNYVRITPNAEPEPDVEFVSIALLSNVLLSTVSFVNDNVPSVPVVNAAL